MVKVTSYFEIDARAEMAYDLDTNEPCEAYLYVGTEHSKQLTDEEMGEVRGVHRKMIAEQIGIPSEWLKPISAEEYEANTGEDDE